MSHFMNILVLTRIGGVDTVDKPILDFRKRKFYRMTRSIVNDESNGLKPVDIAVYSVLCMYADNDDMSAYPSVDTIAKKSRCSERTVYRSLDNLKEGGYIDIINRKDKRGFKTSNQYILLDVGD